MAVHDQSLAMRRRSGGLAGDDALRLPPEPRDSERNRVARPQEDRRLLTEAHARRRARGDDVPRLEDHELRDVGDEGFAPKTMVAVEPLCMRSPLTSSHMSSFCASSISSGVTSHGPNGPKVGQLLPFIHWPARSIWNARSETSLHMQ